MHSTASSTMEQKSEQRSLLHDSKNERSGTSRQSSGEVNPESVEKTDNRSVKNTFIGYICILLLLTGYSVATIAAQIMGHRTSMFLINIFRFSVLFIIAMLWVVATKSSICVAREDVYKVILASTSNYIKSTMFYISAAFMPVGNLDGLYGGLLLIISTAIDFCFKEISKMSILVSGIALAGVIMLTQPWDFHIETDLKEVETPCDYISYVRFEHNITYNNSDFIDSVTLSTAWQGSLPNASIPIEGQSFVSNKKNSIMVGYILIVLAVICSVVSGYLQRSLIGLYSTSCVAFWSGVTSTSLSVLIVIIMKLANSSHLILPSSYTCIGYTSLFLVSATVANVAAILVFKYLPVSKTAVSKAFAVVILYIVQRTLLAEFHPGNENTVEILGIVIIFIASILCPLVSIFYETEKKE